MPEKIPYFFEEQVARTMWERDGEPDDKGEYERWTRLVFETIDHLGLWVGRRA